VTDAGDIASDNSKGRVAPDRLLRDRSRDSRVTNIELFFDLVYVFAVTQLSHHLLSDPTLRGDRASLAACAAAVVAAIAAIDRAGTAR